MSYRSRLYNHRNAQGPDKKNEPFFSHRRAEKKPKKSGHTQAGLSVNAPGDSHEKEADATADTVVNKPGKDPGVQRKKISRIVQRHSSPKEEEKLSTNDARIRNDKEIHTKPMEGVDKEKEGAVHMKGMPGEKEKEPIQKKGMPGHDEKEGSLQMKEDTGGAAVSHHIAERIARSSGGGEPLPPPILREMNASFHTDFSHVRIHTGSEAADLCKQLGAQAFTHGSHIYFNEGKFDPGSKAGKLLLAHELTHVLQQRSDI